MSKKRLHAMRSGVPKGNAELLLAEDVPALGKQGEIVRVKSGYARNYLVPQGLATIATDENKRMVERHRVRLAELQKDRMKSIRQMAEQLSEYSVTLEANANPEGHLYGSITAPEISKALKAAKYDYPCGPGPPGRPAEGNRHVHGQNPPARRRGNRRQSLGRPDILQLTWRRKTQIRKPKSPADNISLSRGIFFAPRYIAVTATTPPSPQIRRLN